MVKYTIIIPHKNCSELLERCLSSIPCDDSFEVILIDDCSDDVSSVKYQISKINNKNLRVIYSDTTHGAGYSRNIGLSLAQGEWVIFLDADDFFSDSIWSIIRVAETGTADIVYFKHQGRYSDSLEECLRFPVRNFFIDNYLNCGNEKAELKLKFGDTVPWGKIYKKSLITDNYIQFDEIICCEDVMFTTRCAVHAKKIMVLPDIGYNITFRRDSLSLVRSVNHQFTAYKVQLERNLLMRSIGHPELCTRVLSHVILAFRLYGVGESWKYFKTARSYKQNIFTGLWMSWGEIKEKIKELTDSSYHKN